MWMDNCNVSPEKCVFSKMAMRGGNINVKRHLFYVRTEFQKIKSLKKKFQIFLTNIF